MPEAHESAEGDLHDERDADRIDGGGGWMRRHEPARAGQQRRFGAVAGVHAAERPAGSHRSGAGGGQRRLDRPVPRRKQLLAPRARARDRPRRSLRAAGGRRLRWHGGGQLDGGFCIRLRGARIVRAHARGGAAVRGPDHFLGSVGFRAQGGKGADRLVRSCPEPPGGAALGALQLRRDPGRAGRGGGAQPDRPDDDGGRRQAVGGCATPGPEPRVTHRAAEGVRPRLRLFNRRATPCSGSRGKRSTARAET